MTVPVDLFPKKEYSIDFTQKWHKSDKIIKTDDSDQLLYVNANVLASYSPYFEALFSEFFIESMQEIIEIKEVPFEILLLILKLIHNLERNIKTVLREDRNGLIVALYAAADKLDFPLVRDICKETISEMELFSAYFACSKIGFVEQKRKLLQKMTISEIKQALSGEKSQLFLTNDDVLDLIKRIEKNLDPMKHSFYSVDDGELRSSRSHPQERRSKFDPPPMR